MANSHEHINTAQQEHVAIADGTFNHNCPIGTRLYTSPPAHRKPLTHEQRVNLLAKFEDHKNEWHAPAILIDMVEAAHGIKENT